MAKKKLHLGAMEDPKTPKIMTEVIMTFRGQQTGPGEDIFRKERRFADAESRALWFSRWDSIPFETRNEMMRKYQIAGVQLKTPAELESIRKEIEDAVVAKASKLYGAKYKDEVRKQFENEMRNSTTEVLNRLLEQENKRVLGVAASEKARDDARKAAESYAAAQGRVFTQGGKSEIESKASYKPDPESFKPFAPEDAGREAKKLAELDAQYRLTQLANKVQSIRAAAEVKVRDAQDKINRELNFELSRLKKLADVSAGASPRDRFRQAESIRRLETRRDAAIQAAEKRRLAVQIEGEKALAQSAMFAQQLALEESRAGMKAASGEAEEERLRHAIELTKDAIKRGGVGGFKISVPARKMVMVGIEKVEQIRVRDEDGKLLEIKTVVKPKLAPAAAILPEQGARPTESEDSREFYQRLRQNLIEDQIEMRLALQGRTIADLTKDERRKLLREASEEIAPQLRATGRGGAITKTIQFSAGKEREAINAGKQMAKEKMGNAAWNALDADQKQRAGEEYADRFYKPFVYRTGPTGKSELGEEFARPDPKASKLLNEEPKLFTPSGFGMKMRSAAGADKRVRRDVPNSAYADEEIWRSMGKGVGALREAKYLNPQWVAAAFGTPVLEAAKARRKALGIADPRLETQITRWDLHSLGFNPDEPRYQIVAPIQPTMFGQAHMEWRLSNMQREVDPTLSRQIYANGKILDVGSKEGKRELFIRGARATLYGAKAGGEKAILREARRMALEQIEDSDLYPQETAEDKQIREAKLEELTGLAADIILSREPMITKSYTDKIRNFNARLADRSVKTAAEKTKAVRGKRIAQSTGEEKITAIAENAVFDRYSLAAHQAAGGKIIRDESEASGRPIFAVGNTMVVSAEPLPRDFQDRVIQVKGRFTKVTAEAQYLAARAKWVKRYDEAFNRAATNLEKDLPEAMSQIRGGARRVAEGTLIVRKKKLDGLGFGFGSYDLGSKITITAVGGLVAFGLFKALTSKGTQS